MFKGRVQSFAAVPKQVLFRRAPGSEQVRGSKRDGRANLVWLGIAIEVGFRAASIDEGPISRHRPVIELTVHLRRGGSNRDTEDATATLLLPPRLSFREPLSGLLQISRGNCHRLLRNRGKRLQAIDTDE